MPVLNVPISRTLERAECDCESDESEEICESSALRSLKAAAQKELSQQHQQHQMNFANHLDVSE